MILLDFNFSRNVQQLQIFFDCLTLSVRQAYFDLILNLAPLYCIYTPRSVFH